MNIIKSQLIIVLVFILILCNITCKKSTDPVTQLCSPFTGITETDATGMIIGNTDTDDWQPSGILTVYPAYPNPCDTECSFVIFLTEGAILKITVNSTPKTIIGTLQDGGLPTGYYNFRWVGKNDSGEIVPDCIYRVYFSATTNAGVIYQTYGDIQLKH